jgi:hypothetical protein
MIINHLWSFKCKALQPSTVIFRIADSRLSKLFAGEGNRNQKCHSIMHNFNTAAVPKRPATVLFSVTARAEVEFLTKNYNRKHTLAEQRCSECSSEFSR